MSKAQDIIERFNIVKADSESDAIDKLISKLNNDDIEKLTKDVVQAGDWQNLGMAPLPKIQKLADQFGIPMGKMADVVKVINGQKTRAARLDKLNNFQ